MPEPSVSLQSARLAASPSAAAPPFKPSPYSFDVTQALIDQTAYLPLYAVPEQNPGSGAVRHIQEGEIQATEQIHRFQVYMNPPSRTDGVKAVNVAGEYLGKAVLQWLIVPDGVAALPGLKPPPTALDPSRSQRFTMLQTRFSFAGDQDSFSCFGTGRTFPCKKTSELLVAASGDIIEGTGVFKSTQGSCIFLGRLDPESGFIGSIFARTSDPHNKLTVEEIPSIEPNPDIELEATYFVFRGHEDTSLIKPPAASPPTGAPGGGLSLNQVIRAIYVECGTSAWRGIRSSRQVGMLIGNQVATVHFDPSQLPGLSKPFASIPFQGEDTFTFLDNRGENIASIHAVASDGAILNLQLTGAPQQQAVRIVGFGPASNGTGALNGAEGLFHSMAFNALPPIPSSFYVLRINDPGGKYRE